MLFKMLIFYRNQVAASNNS